MGHHHKWHWNSLKQEKNKDVTAADIKDYDARSWVTLSTIYRNVDLELCKIIGDCDDPKNAWDKLENHYQPDNTMRNMMLFSEFCSCCIKNNESINLLTARIKHTAGQLKSINQRIGDFLVISINQTFTLSSWWNTPVDSSEESDWFCV